MFSSTVIEAPLRLLIIDAAADESETETASRLTSALVRRGVPMASPEVLRVSAAGELSTCTDLLDAATCLVLLGSGRDGPGCLSLWEWLGDHTAGPKLAVVCQWGGHDAGLSDAVLKAKPAWAPVAVAQESDAPLREGGLFLLKFVNELDLHSDHQITGRMAWFSWRKADELIKRRRMGVRFGLRA